MAGLLLEPAVVRGPDLAPPAEGLLALAPVMLVLALISLVLLFRHLRRRRRQPPSERRASFMVTLACSAALGSVLIELNAMFDPSRPVAMLVQEDRERRSDRAPRAGPAEPRAAGAAGAAVDARCLPARGRSGRRGSQPASTLNWV